MRRGTPLPGFIAMEIARVDCSFATFFGVHSGLATGLIFLQIRRTKWLAADGAPERLCLRSDGCRRFCSLGGLLTTATREGDNQS